MSIQTRAPSVTILAPGTPAPPVTLMWAETPFSVLLASSGYTSTAPPSPVLTFAQSVQLALQWAGVARRAAPKVKLAPYSDHIPRYDAYVPSTPAPRVPPHYYLAFINRVPLHIFTGSVGRRILLVVPVDTLYRTAIISYSTVLPLNLFVNLSLAPLSLFFTYGPDLGVWPTVGSPRSSSAPPSLGRGRVVPPQPPSYYNLARSKCVNF